MIEEKGDVFPPLAQRRYGQMNDVQTVVQIFAKRLVRGVLEQVLVGRGDHAHVDH